MNLKLPLILAATATISTVSACAPFFQSSYMVPGNAYRISLNKTAAIKHFVEMHRDLLPEPFAFEIGVKSSFEAHKLDFAAAVKNGCLNFHRKNRMKCLSVTPALSAHG